MNGQPVSGLNNKNGHIPGREVLPSGAPLKFLTFSFFLFLLTLLIYFGLSVGYKAFLNERIDDLEASIEELRFEVPPEEQEELIKFFSQVANTQAALDEHIIGTNLFRMLEENTHTQVAFTNMDLSVVERRVGLDGVTANYDTLVEQLTILESVPEIENVVLENSQRSGAILGFRINITVDRDLFDFDNARTNTEPVIEESETTEEEQ